MTNKSPVLVLNASYEPIAICPVRRALTLLSKGTAAMEESHDVLVWREMRMPSVIRLNRYRKVPQKRHIVTRRAVNVHTARSLMRMRGEEISSWRKYLYF